MRSQGRLGSDFFEAIGRIIVTVSAALMVLGVAVTAVIALVAVVIGLLVGPGNGLLLGLRMLVELRIHWVLIAVSALFVCGSATVGLARVRRRLRERPR